MLGSEMADADMDYTLLCVCVCVYVCVCVSERGRVCVRVAGGLDARRERDGRRRYGLHPLPLGPGQRAHPGIPLALALSLALSPSLPPSLSRSL